MVGSRFHGNTMALLSGVPAVYAPFDWRTLELCHFHGFPTLHKAAYQDMNGHLKSLSPVQISHMRQKRDYAIACFRSFLVANGLDAVV